MRMVFAASTAALAFALSATTAMGSHFTGAYIGVDLGYGWGDANSQNFGAIGGPLTSTQADAELDGFVGGGHIGHAWSIAPNWILGVEGGFRFNGLEGDDGGSSGDVNELSANWDASLQAQLGVLAGPNTMLYVTGGFAWLDADSNVTDPGEQETVSETFGGWTLGGGLAFGLGPNCSGRIQYRYTDYDEEVLTFPVNIYDMAVGPTTHEVTVGVSWHL